MPRDRPGSRYQLVSAFSGFLLAADGERYPFPQEDASPHADNPYPPRSPRTFAGSTVDDLDSVDAQQLGKWLHKHTGDAQAAVVLKAPPRDGETSCAIEIRWHDPEPGHLRIPAGEGVSVVAAFSRFLEANEPRNQQPRRSPSGICPNYNVRVYNPDAGHRQWCQDRDIPIALFINYDGGGYNFHIFEFQALEHATAFMAAFEIQGERRLWAEDENGKHYDPLADVAP